MVSNTPWLPLKWIKRMHYADFPEDLRPSKGAKRLSHIGGAVGELIPPLILLFSHNATADRGRSGVHDLYHAFINSTFPLAVPMEWNVMFMFITAFLFLGYPATRATGRRHGPGAARVTVAALLFFPVLGELRPHLVSFLPVPAPVLGELGERMWAFAPGVRGEARRPHRQAGAVRGPAHRHVRRGHRRRDLHQYLAGGRCTARGGG